MEAPSLSLTWKQSVANIMQNSGYCNSFEVDMFTTCSLNMDDDRHSGSFHSDKIRFLCEAL